MGLYIEGIMTHSILNFEFCDASAFLHEFDGLLVGYEGVILPMEKEYGTGDSVHLIEIAEPLLDQFADPRARQVLDDILEGSEWAYEDHAAYLEVLGGQLHG